MRRLLRLWLEYDGHFLGWLEQYGPDAPTLTVDGVQDVLGCSRSTAYNYLAAAETLYKIDKLDKAKTRISYNQWAKMAKLRGQDTSRAAWLDSIRQAHRVTG